MYSYNQKTNIFFLWPWTFIYDLDLRIWLDSSKTNLQAKYLEQRSFHSKVSSGHTDRRTQLTDCFARTIKASTCNNNNNKNLHSLADVYSCISRQWFFLFPKIATWCLLCSSIQSSLSVCGHITTRWAVVQCSTADYFSIYQERPRAKYLNYYIRQVNRVMLWFPSFRPSVNTQYLDANISKTVWDRDLVPINH